MRVIRLILTILFFPITMLVGIVAYIFNHFPLEMKVETGPSLKTGIYVSKYLYAHGHEETVNYLSTAPQIHVSQLEPGSHSDPLFCFSVYSDENFFLALHELSDFVLLFGRGEYCGFNARIYDGEMTSSLEVNFEPKAKLLHRYLCRSGLSVEADNIRTW